MNKRQTFPVPRPLTGLERRVFAHHQVGELAPFAIERLILGFDARFSRDRLVAAIEDLLATHPAFTARIEVLPGGETRRHGDGATRLEERGPGGFPEAVRRAEGHRPDPLGAAARAELWHDRQGGHILALTLHPVLGDDTTFGSIEAALSRVLGQTAARRVLAEPPAPPREERARRLAYWQERLDGFGIARLPRRHDAVEGPERRLAERVLEADLNAALDQAGAERALSAALGALLARYTGQADLRFALGQERDGARERAGTVLPLCLATDPGQGFREAMEAAAAALAEARAHILPADTLAQDRLRHAGADSHPLGAVVLHIRPMRALPDGVSRLARPRPPATGELVLTAEQGSSGWRLIADAEAGLFEAAVVDRFLLHLARLLSRGLAEPELPLGRAPLLSHDELADLSAPYRDSVEDDPRATHELIAEHAARTPDRIAIICGADRWTHAELDGRANALAHRLVALGVGAEVPVAILIERGAEAVMAILATLKAGGAYIPVEPDHPTARNHHILTDAGVRVVLTRGRYRDRLPAGLKASVLCLEDLTDPPRADAPAVTIHPDQLAYMMYTSGSTGKPKGVAVEHGPLSHHNQATGRVYEMHADSRELPFLPFSSDGGHERWMAPLLKGGSIVIPDGPLWTPEQTLGAMREHGCDNASIPTTYLRQLAEWAEETESAPPMRLYSFGGEGLAQSTFDLLSRSLRAEILINGYGPTETIMTPMVWKVRAGTRFEGVYAPLGRAVGDRRAYVLDAELMPCPPGVVGEIYLGGKGVARGYVGRPDTTADVFIPDPFGPELDGVTGARLYRTGDLGRWREDGTIDFIGRADLQIKINGYRIEPGEIESALLAEPGVAEALVLLRGDGAEKRLLAYVVGPALDAGEALLAALETRLPRHMLPEAVIVLERMPTNPNAKLDRAALPMPGARVRPTLGVPPEGEIETGVLTIWRDLVNQPTMGVTDDFFAMGGKSLIALKALAAMRRRWPGVALTIADLFDAPTARGIAARISVGGQTGRSAIALRAGGSKPPLYCFPGLLVSTREYARLTDFLGPDQPVTGFLCHSLNEEKRLNVSVEDVVADYAAHIRAESAGGPCAFLGWSWGGLLAWEAARQLVGEIDLKLIGMVDVCDLGADFTPGAPPVFCPGERVRLRAELEDWLGRTRMRPQWDQLIAAMDPECFEQFLRFIGNEAEPLPFDGPEISSREHTFWVLIDNALVFRRHRMTWLDVPVASFSAADTLSRGLNLIDWRKWTDTAGPAEIVAGTNHLHIIGERGFHERFRSRLNTAFAGG